MSEFDKIVNNELLESTRDMLEHIKNKAQGNRDAKKIRIAKYMDNFTKGTPEVDNDKFNNIMRLGAIGA
ncbi:hypothetical protein N7499_007271 [Penicillium canescens]|uniref:Uncharacterized protein n=1 Tax=Penicillium canescens TaxID=5083 RepID=A0AAD6IF33_PENCN|nr:uncharacterized protein N7446_002962 [Penicillium canescens]KAJ5996412.1 hypothetical protein N7522_008072 [Penicillium canescens]KAJ6044768.1 hypothetical protein N7460_006123 [Penicillium canescens]KAJ6056237.1 hypothetical protein N7444_005335 [Penicillium canescens]KAJ6075185.1 hypothetical protein N7446_002962 [Penicillium canescens]KAJ6082397.1 hypothetical protein N7499_007271 [Penicillium canescens]